MALIQEAVRTAASELEQPASAMLQQLRRVKGLNFGVANISLGVQLDIGGHEHPRQG